MSIFVVIIEVISYGPLKVLTRFITLTGVDPVYTTCSCERALHNAKHGQYHLHFQAY